jgi:hypothetical protein
MVCAKCGLIQPGSPCRHCGAIEQVTVSELGRRGRLVMENVCIDCGGSLHFIDGQPVCMRCGCTEYDARAKVERERDDFGVSSIAANIRDYKLSYAAFISPWTDKPITKRSVRDVKPNDGIC